MVGFCYLFMRFLLKIWLNGGVTKKCVHDFIIVVLGVRLGDTKNAEKN